MGRSFVALCKQMKKDGLVPIAFGDKDAWPALGTFDQINFRKNGYDFHVELMAGKASWTDAKVKSAFDLWAEILPVPPGRRRRPHLAGRGADPGVEEGRHVPAGHLRGASSSPTRPTSTTSTSSPSRRSTRRTARTPSRRPTDGFMMSKSPKNKAEAVKLLEFLGTPEAEEIYLKADPSVVAASTKAPTPRRTRLCRRRRTT